MTAADDAADTDEASQSIAPKAPAADPNHSRSSIERAATDSQARSEHDNGPQTPRRGAVRDEEAALGRRAERDESSDNHDDDQEASDGDDDDEEEPQLKYDKITGRLASIYRNGDSSSALTVTGNKLVVGTDNGSVHVLALPSFTPLRTFRPHTASILSCSISPPYPLLTRVNHKESHSVSTEQPSTSAARPTPQSPNGKAGRAGATQPHLTNTPDNAIHIATSSLDGNVCVLSLLDPKDVLIRNFARPVNAVALSPEYKSDRTYLSGGKAGQLVVTKGGKAGVRTDANTSSASAAASGWLSSIGLASDTGKDSILHHGEGVISTIKWSRSGKWVVWVNEEGVKIMRSHIKLGSEESEYAWRRIAHAAKPERRIWEEMAGVWKAKAQWFDEAYLEADSVSHDSTTNGTRQLSTTSPSKSKTSRLKSTDKLVVGWGDTAWILHVQERASKPGGHNTGKMPIGNAEIVHKLYFQDCIVSGVALYTPTYAAILAYRTRDDDDRPISPSANRDKDTPRKGRAHRRTGLAPQLRLVDVRNGEELDVDELPMSRFETLSAQDYSLESLWVPPLPAAKSSKDAKGTLEGLWEVSGGYYAQKLLSSGASVLSRSSSGFDENTRRGSFMNRAGTNPLDTRSVQTPDKAATASHQYLLQPGLKFFIQSPYDCVLAVKRQATDRLDWLLSRQQYAQAWTLIDEQPEVAANPPVGDDVLSISSGKTGRQAPGQSLADFLAGDDSASVSSVQDRSNAAIEKQRIGDLWIGQLTALKDWKQAGEVAGKVLGDGRRWDYWIKTFNDADQLDLITPYVPSHVTHPVIPGRAYELILTHYIRKSPARVCELLDEWEEGLFDAANIASTVKDRVADSSVAEGSEDWRWLLEALARLNLSLANPREALDCYIRTQNAESAFRLLQEEKLADALGDDVPGFVTLNVSKKQLRSATLPELDEASERAIKILAEEAFKSTVYPDTVIRQLQQKGTAFRPFIYFYLRTLWRGVDVEKVQQISRRLFNRATLEGHAMVEDHADLAVELFAEYDRPLLMEFLEASEVYDYNRAAILCEQKQYTQELVLVLNRTGQTKRALWLIIGELGDASQAIAFVKQNPDLWDDLLEYGMDKPAFIRGLLAEVGTSIDPVKVVRNIPEGLEIDGLKEGILSLVQGWEVQLEVSRGVDRVLHGEVMAGMETLRKGQRQAVRFEVTHDTPSDLELEVVPPPLDAEPGAESFVPLPHKHVDPKPGHCVGCGELFHEDETETLLGFACGHVYHLSCLLRADDKTDPKQYESLMASIRSGSADTEVDRSYSRSVGVKVAHAHIIRNVVRSGCQHCSQVFER